MILIIRKAKFSILAINDTVYFSMQCDGNLNTIADHSAVNDQQLQSSINNCFSS